MTSPSRKKRPITRRSTLRSKGIDAGTSRTGGFRLWLAALAVSSSAAGALAAEPAASPLDHLRQRSAAGRWEDSKEEFLPPKKVQIPPAAVQAPVRDAGIAPAGGGERPQLEFTPGELPRQLVQVPDPEQPLTVQAPISPVPDASNLTPDDDAQTIFRPITAILPFNGYSVLSKTEGEYACPPPANLPEGTQLTCPDRLPLSGFGSLDRHFGEVNFMWCASNLVHQPLYFEDVKLERYGQTLGPPLQPFVSLGKFGVDVLALPYTMSLDPVWNEQYALGYYRPGDCAPELIYQPPLNGHAALSATGIWTGLFFLFP